MEPVACCDNIFEFKNLLSYNGEIVNWATSPNDYIAAL